MGIPFNSIRQAFTQYLTLFFILVANWTSQDSHVVLGTIDIIPQELGLSSYN